MHTTATTRHDRPTRRKRTRRAALLTAVASVVGIGTASGPADAHGRWSYPVDLAGRSFAVETVVTYSQIPSFPAGSESEACYTFVDDSVFLDTEFPVPGGALPGTYTVKYRHNKTRYVANVEDTLLSLEQRGTVRQRANGKVVLRAKSDVTYLGALFVQVRSKGYEVDSCD